MNQNERMKGEEGMTGLMRGVPNCPYMKNMPSFLKKMVKFLRNLLIFFENLKVFFEKLKVFFEKLKVFLRTHRSCQLNPVHFTHTVASAYTYIRVSPHVYMHRATRTYASACMYICHCVRLRDLYLNWLLLLEASY